MALNALGLGFVFTARDLASQPINQLTRNFGAMDRATDRAARRNRTATRTMAAGLGVMTAGLVGLGGAFALASGAGEFEQQLQRVAGITRATTPELNQLRQAAIQAGIQTQFSPDEAVAGLGALGSMGFRAAESMRLLTPSLQLASGGMIGVADATSTVASATRIFGLSMDEAQGSADRLLRITQLTALQAGELQLALGTVARGASQTGQNLNEMLIAMGLVRNTGVQASVAASSVSSALQFMARNSQRIRSTLGVSVTDASGRFRNFIDIVQESSGELNRRFPNAADRSRVAMQLFGRFGITAFSAIQNQLTNGVRNAAGEMVTGAAAVAALREQMSRAGGTAQNFSDRLLNTFRGQMVLLSGSLQTMKVLFGTAFGQALKPIVGGVIAFINQIIAAWNAMPAGVRRGIASFILASGAILTALGAFIAFSGALAFVAPMIGAISQAALGLALALSPLIAAFVALGLVILGFRELVRRNIGGVAITIMSFISRIRLAWRGLTELFTRGGFSKGLMQELQRSGNQGILRFVTGIFQLAFRLQRMWDGVKAGISGVIAASGPAVTAMITAFRALGRTIGLSFGGIGEAAGGLRSKRFVEFGQRVGAAIGGMVRFVVRGITWMVTKIRQGIVLAHQIFEFFRPTINNLRKSFGLLWSGVVALGQQFGIMGSDVSGSSNLWSTLGQILGGVVLFAMRKVIEVISGIAVGIGILLHIMAIAIDVFRRVGNAGRAVGISLNQIFTNVGATIMNMIDQMIAGLGRLARAIPARIRPAFLGGLAEAGTGAESRIDARNASLRTQNAAFAEQRRSALAEPAQRRARQGQTRDATSIAAAQRIVDAQRTRDGGIFRVNLNMDGRRLASATQRVNREDRVARGLPVQSDE